MNAYKKKQSQLIDGEKGRKIADQENHTPLATSRTVSPKMSCQSLGIAMTKLKRPKPIERAICDSSLGKVDVYCQKRKK